MKPLAGPTRVVRSGNPGALIAELIDVLVEHQDVWLKDVRDLMAVLAPYHDVGMTAIKVASFGKAVNVTLGLPFIRTSPDHGTALDIAAHGTADESSLVSALRMAGRMAASIA